MGEFTGKIDFGDITDKLTQIEIKLNLILSKLDPVIPVLTKEVIWTDQQFKELVASGRIELQDGVSYRLPRYARTVLTKDLLITCKGKATIIFGNDYYNQWDNASESEVIFFLGRWNNKVRIENVDLTTGKLVNEVQPFYRTLFLNTPEKDQIGVIELINSNTSLELGLLYSGSQDKYLTVRAEKINFEGIIWQELKANNGGGLLSIMRDCNLKQIDPITYFKSKITLLNNNTLFSTIAFRGIQNEFIEFGNSANIVFVDGKTFYLPKTTELGNTKTIRPIPSVDQEIEIEWDGTYLGSNKHELQAGDEFEFNGVFYRIKAKDRAAYPKFEEKGYFVEYAIDKPLPVTQGLVKIKVIKSTGLELLNIPLDGYLIFKYNKNFQTNVDIDHGLDYMLDSNPIGVLSYNHKEITVDWENLNHDGFYRQSASNVGFSNGYRLVNITGLKDQFSPPK